MRRYQDGEDSTVEVKVSEVQGLAAAGTIGAETLVWAEGMEGWAPFSSVAGKYLPSCPPTQAAGQEQEQEKAETAEETLEEAVPPEIEDAAPEPEEVAAVAAEPEPELEGVKLEDVEVPEDSKYRSMRPCVHRALQQPLEAPPCERCQIVIDSQVRQVWRVCRPWLAGWLAHWHLRPDAGMCGRYQLKAECKKRKLLDSGGTQAIMQRLTAQDQGIKTQEDAGAEKA